MAKRNMPRIVAQERVHLSGPDGLDSALCGQLLIGPAPPAAKHREVDCPRCRALQRWVFQFRREGEDA